MKEPPPVRFYVHPFGCQMNRHDAEALAGRLVADGYVPARGPDDADVVLYFTCSVRQHAEDRVWSHLGRWRKARESGGLRVLGVLGCMAERLGQGIRRRMPHVNLVAGPRRLPEAPGMLADILAGGGPVVATGPPAEATADGPCCLDPARAMRPSDFQAFLPVMHGCNGRCTYCVVPSVRGGERSLPPDEIERAARDLVGQGVVEITLLGQNIDRYGLDLAGGPTLAGLIGRLASALGAEGLARLRFVTSNPRDVTDELFEAMAAHPNVCPYLHAPAQSGSDGVLAAMGRGYTRAEYLRMLESARRIVPGVEVASDFIVGFPGETADDFDRTLSLVEEARFQNAFLFKYSPRPGTPAYGLADDVPGEVKVERHRRLSEAQLSVSRELNAALVGATVEVLVEGRSRLDAGRWTGRTPTGRTVAFLPGADPASGRGDLAGRIVRVRVEDATALVLLGGLAV